MNWKTKPIVAGSFEEEMYGESSVPKKPKGGIGKKHNSLNKCDGCGKEGNYATGKCFRCRKPCIYCGGRIEYASAGSAYHIRCATKKRKQEVKDEFT